MRKKRKPHEDRQPEDYQEAAEDSLELAKVLAGQGGISGQDFLERMARSDELVDHDGTTCGQCYYTILGAEVAREMIEAGGCVLRLRQTNPAAAALRGRFRPFLRRTRKV